jgi:hypothetical protein
MLDSFLFSSHLVVYYVSFDAYDFEFSFLLPVLELRLSAEFFQ